MNVGGMPDEQEIQGLVRTCQRADLLGEELPPEERGAAAEAWAALHAHFYPRVLAFCQRSLTPDAGEDLAAEILMKVRFRLGSFDASRPFAPWLFRVAANRCWDEARRLRRSEPLDEEGATAIASEAPDPLDRLISLENRKRVQEAVSRLPRRQRFAVTLRYAAGSSYGEIAEILGVTRSNVGVLLLRARRRMREDLADEEN